MQRRSSTSSSREEYQGKRRDEKRTHEEEETRKDEGRGRDMELLNNQNESTKFYRKVNTSRKPFKTAVSLVNNKDGNIIGDNQEIIKRWWRY
jgi:hypothetical protein